MVMTALLAVSAAGALFATSLLPAHSQAGNSARCETIADKQQRIACFEQAGVPVVDCHQPRNADDVAFCRDVLNASKGAPAASGGCYNHGDVITVQGVATAQPLKLANGQVTQGWVLVTDRPICLMKSSEGNNASHEIGVSRLQIVGQPPPVGVLIELTGRLSAGNISRDADLTALVVISGHRIAAATPRQVTPSLPAPVSQAPMRAPNSAPEVQAQTATTPTTSRTPIEEKHVLLDEFKEYLAFVDQLVDLVRANDFRCDFVSSALPHILSHGFELVCNKFQYTYDIQDKGGHWTVTVR